MKSMLEDLWYSYLIEKKIDLSDSDRSVINLYSEKHDKIFDTLSDTQKRLFESYEDSFSEMCNIYEKEAFIKGVSFAVRLFVSALNNSI
ncbi:MAG: hypothetical protein IJA02_10905 [Clostridia bacterium]|nr:hypothetical protein [Clostridia bacterium]MBR6619500.1 hypothetical protein [Clostridia bacterium]